MRILYDKIQAYVEANPGVSAQEVAKKFNLATKSAGMMLGRLVSLGRLRHGENMGRRHLAHVVEYYPMKGMVVHE